MQREIRYRPVSISEPAILVDKESEGQWRFTPETALEPYPRCLTDKLIAGADRHPQRTLIAQRDQKGLWRTVTYADMLDRVRHIGQALLHRDLSPEHPLLILSGNDIEHLQLALGAMYAGIPHCPVSPSYSLLSKEYGKLRHIVSQMTPGLVYVTDAGPFSKAIRSVADKDCEVVADRGRIEDRKTTPLSELLAGPIEDVDGVHQAIQPDGIAKFLFTSGSTSMPKGVITTHRMLCANQQMLLQTFPCFGEEPPIFLDWLPWNHTFGGSHNVGIILYNGGSYYIDEGKPVPEHFAATVRNLHDISPTAFLNVPKGWELLTDVLEQDSLLREKFYARMKLFFFAGAGLSQAAWDRLDAVSEKACGERIRIMTGLGMTETSPSSMFSTGPLMFAGYVGLPAPGCEAKLVPVDDKLEARFRGPHVMPGYWRMPDKTRDAFDAEGFYRTGDALKLADENHPEWGMVFEGRIAEDFKLSTGTFVRVGPLKTKMIRMGEPYVHDAVITGLNRDHIGAMVFPHLEHCLKLSGMDAGSKPRAFLNSGPVRRFFGDLLKKINQDATGSASRLAFIHLLWEPPSIDRHEVTDKGTINQSAVLDHRKTLVDALYAGNEPSVIKA